MAKRRVFYSFHYDNDVMRVQLIRNIGALEGNEPASVNKWEEVKYKGDRAIREWIDVNMANRSCLVVLIGSDTANRKWVNYEIEKAWADGKGVVGVYIDDVRCPRNGICRRGANPFSFFKFPNGRLMSNVVKCYVPNSLDAYNDIRNNIESWIEEAIYIRSLN